MRCSAAAYFSHACKGHTDSFFVSEAGTKMKGMSAGWLFLRQACRGSPDDAGEPDDFKDNPYRRDEKEKTYTEDT